jgi:hypothetical protein
LRADWLVNQVLFASIGVLYFDSSPIRIIDKSKGLLFFVFVLSSLFFFFEHLALLFNKIKIKIIK